MRAAAIVLGTFAALFVPERAQADDTIGIEGRMFLRHEGKFDADVFLDSDPEVHNLDYGVLAEELLLTVRVPAALVPDGGTLVVTVKQGKKTLARQTWKMAIGDVYGIAVGHYPLIVKPSVCSPPMVVTAKIGKLKVSRTLRFPCAE